jgi:hypothetical protein
MALVHVFASTGRFGSEEDVRRFVDMTYTADGDAVRSPFPREIGLEDEYDPGCIEVVHSSTLLPIRQLLRDVSYGDQWVARIDPDRQADTVICVFPPNLVAAPQDSSLEYCGAFIYIP